MSRSVAILVVLSLALLASHSIAAALLGLGDAEALYACYARHLQLSYLDHPPLIGWLLAGSTWALGQTVIGVRAVPMAMIVITLAFIYLLSRDLFGQRAAVCAVALLAATPQVNIGLVAAGPDAPLAAIWSAFAWLFVRTLGKNKEQTSSRFLLPVALGLLAGIGLLAKYTGVFLALGAVIAIADTKQWYWLRRPGFWVAVALVALAAAPIVAWNAAHGWAGLWHRIAWTQARAGLSWSHLGALFGGQLAYVGPPQLALLAWAAVRLWKRRFDKNAELALLALALPTLGAAFALVLWSDVAEPHWPAVGYLTLYPLAGQLVDEGIARARLLFRAAFFYGAALWIAAHVLVLTPLLPALLKDKAYTPEYDLANELRGWPEVAGAVRALNPDRKPVYSGFYTQCSQLAFALGRPGDPEVRCATKEIDDFDFWQADRAAPKKGFFFVTDNRFRHDPKTPLQGAVVVRPPSTVEIRRADRVVRRFEIYELRSGNSD